MDGERESIWSVPKEAKTVYYGAFIGLFVLGMSLLCFRSVGLNDSWSQRVIEIGGDAAPLAITSAAIALVVAEIWRFLMVLARAFEEKFIEPMRERRRQEGVEEAFERIREATPHEKQEEMDRIIEETRKIMKEDKG